LHCKIYFVKSKKKGLPQQTKNSFFIGSSGFESHTIIYFIQQKYPAFLQDIMYLNL